MPEWSNVSVYLNKTEPAPIAPQQGIASWLVYELEDSCASRDYPKGTKLEVRIIGVPEPHIVCVVRDYGPDILVFPLRIIDLNRDQFAMLASIAVGIIEVEIKPVK